MILLLGYIFLYIFRFIFPSNQPPIFGVYHVPGRWYYFKMFGMMCVLFCRRMADKWSSKFGGTHTNAGYGKRSKATVDEMEKVQELADTPKAIDAVYFNSASQDGYYLVVGTARRPHKVINGFLLIQIPGVGLLKSPKMPDSMVFAENDNSYAAEGIEIKPVEPMKKWTIRYKGKMSLDGSDKTFDVVLNTEWTAAAPHFDYDTDIPYTTMARAIAKEKWSRELFDKLREVHQTHYEQFGVITGTITLDGDMTHQLKLDALRDHSYDKSL